MKISPEQSFPDTAVGVRARRRRVKTNGGVVKKARNIEKCVVAPGVAGTDDVVLNSPDIRAYFDGMSSLDIREVITLLEVVSPIFAGRAVIHP